MSVEENLALAKRFVAAFNERDVKGLASFLAPNLHYHAPQIAEGTTDYAGTVRFYEGFFKAFPDTEAKEERRWTSTTAWRKPRPGPGRGIG